MSRSLKYAVYLAICGLRNKINRGLRPMIDRWVLSRCNFVREQRVRFLLFFRSPSSSSSSFFNGWAEHRSTETVRSLERYREREIFDFGHVNGGSAQAPKPRPRESLVVNAKFEWKRKKKKKKKKNLPANGGKGKEKKEKVRRSRSEWVAFTRAFEIEQQPSSVAPQHARLVYCILITRDLAVRDVYAKYRNGIVRCVPV